MYYSHDIPETPPTGYTLQRPIKTVIKDKKNQDPYRPGAWHIEENPAEAPLTLATSVSAAGQSCDFNISGSESSELADLQSQNFFPYAVGAAVAIPHFEKQKRFAKSQSIRYKGSSRSHNQLVRSISFTSKSINKSFEDAVSFCSILESRRQSISVPNIMQYERTGTLRSVSYECDEYSESDDVNYSIEPQQMVAWTWKNRVDFAVLCICQALGLSNVWRFPYFAYSNGGGSFLLAYVIMMLACSGPLLCLEFVIGQITGGQAILALKKICPLLKGIGIAGIASTFWLTTFYSVLIAWAMFYSFNSLYSIPRWLHCFQSWNTKDCQEKPGIQFQSTLVVNVTPILSSTTQTSFLLTKQMGNAQSVLNPTISSVSNVSSAAEEFFHRKLLEASTGVDSLGELRFELLAAILFAWIFLFVAVRKPSILVGHTRYILAIFPNILFLILVVRSSYLEGSSAGIIYLFQPKWEGLQNLKVWLYALAQTFHSFGLVFGYGIAVGACDNQQLNMYKNTGLSVLSNLYVQLIVSCIIFSTAGHLSYKWNRPVEMVFQHGPGLVFIAFSELIGTMPIPTFWAIFTFIVILFIAMDSQVTLIQTLLAAVKEVYNEFLKHYFHGNTLFLLFLCGFSLFCSVPYVTQAGIYYFQLSEHYVSVLATTVLALLEFIVVAWIYGSDKLSVNIQHIYGKKPPFFLTFTWCLLSPLTIIGILITYVGFDDSVSIRANYTYPKWAFSLGWLVLGFTLGWIPFCAITTLRRTSDNSVMDRIRDALKASQSPQHSTVWEPQPIIVLKSPVKSIHPTYPFPGHLDSFSESESETTI